MASGIRRLAAASGLAAGLISAVVFAPVASAVDGTFGCTAPRVVSNFSPSYGQVLTFTITTAVDGAAVDGCRQMFVYNEDRLTYTATKDGNPIVLQYGTPITLDEGSTYVVTVTVPTSGTGDLLSLSLNNATGPLQGDVIYMRLPGTGLAGSGPPDVLQQVGVPSSGQCVDVDDSDASFLGYGGGWSKTWAEWINQGTGGEVCTRTLSYHAGTGQWRIE